MVFQPGQSGNPGGRPRAAADLAKLVRENTRDGALLVEIAIKTLGAEDAASRNYAHQWLSDRGFGKPLQSVDVLDTSSIAPEQAAMLEALHLTPHERRAKLAELRAKAVAVAASDSPDRSGDDE